MTTTHAQSTTTPDTEYPRAWRWEEDGLRADGTYVMMDRAPSEYGEQPILVLEIDGESRSVWVNTTALRSKLADELRRRGERNFVVGEPIIVTRGAEKKVSSSDRQYWPFVVRFPDARQSDAADLLGDVPDDGGGDQKDDGDQNDGGIPF